MTETKIFVAVVAESAVVNDIENCLSLISGGYKLSEAYTQQLMDEEQLQNIDILFLDKMHKSDELVEKTITTCGKFNVSIVNILPEPETINTRYNTNALNIYLPINTQEIALSLHTCEIKKKANQQINIQKDRAEEMMLSLANSNVRVLLLSEAVQNLSVYEADVVNQGKFEEYICDFLKSIITITDSISAFFVRYTSDGSIHRLYDNNSQLHDYISIARVQEFSLKIYQGCQADEDIVGSAYEQFSDKYDDDGKLIKLAGIPVFATEKIYGSVITFHKDNSEKPEFESTLHSITTLTVELEKSITRIILTKKISRQNKALYTTNTRMGFLLKSSPAVLFNLSIKNYEKFEFLSDNIFKLTGYSAKELMKNDRLFVSLVHSEDVSSYKNRIADLNTTLKCMREYRINTKFGSALWVHEEIIAHKNQSGEITDIVGYLVNIDTQVQAKRKLHRKNTELEEAYKNLELTRDKLLQSEKLASIGQLAAGVAHEINNPVGYISSNLSSLNDYAMDLIEVIENITLPLTEDNYSEVSDNVKNIIQKVDYNYIKNDLPELLDQSLDGVKRVKRIVQDLKDFSHADEEDWSTEDLHKGISSTLNIVNNEIKYKAKVTQEYGDIPKIECIPAQLNQVFMNMLVNASHAIEKKGEIVIRTWMMDKFVFVSFTDNGQGIKPENLKRLFDPFFTTKPVGEGTGLGLSLSYGIIERHSGEILVDSTIGKGTTFTIKLPISQIKQKVANE